MPKKTVVMREQVLSDCSDEDLLEELVVRWGYEMEQGAMAPCEVRDHCRKLLCDTLHCGDNYTCPLCLS